MTTSEINAQRLDLVSGKGTAALVAAVRERLRAIERRRIIAIVRSTQDSGFVVTAPPLAPADFAQAVAEIDSRPPVCEWRDHGVINNEVIGDEFSRQPFLY